jgi:hypothetical protein
MNTNSDIIKHNKYHDINEFIDKKINIILKNESFQMCLTLFLGICVGHTLAPEPKVLINLFKNSFTFKYFMLILLGIRNFYPLNINKIIKLLIFSFILLMFIELLRKI